MLFVVKPTRGPDWDTSKPLQEQDGWPEHAAFMNRLAAAGFVVLGGPVSEDGQVMLIVDAADEDEIRSKLAGDPWRQSGLLESDSIERWTILLDAADPDASLS